MTKVFSVSAVNRYVKKLISEDVLLSSVFVKGEVSNLKYHTSGHIYFSLKDQTGAISCVMFAGMRGGLTFRMENGDTVIVAGTIDVYERDGRYQLYARSIRREGAGELYEKFLALKKELEEMGMFDPRYKKPIGKYNRTVGVVTAPTGAAIRDIQNIAARRNPYVQLILCPAYVQGENAAPSIAEGIRKLNRLGVDVIICGRGGGSMEDLWAFNEETVARAIFESEIPVISAVGHETDTTIADFVADLRAPTPSAAAELAVFDIRSFDADLLQRKNILTRDFVRSLDKVKNEERHFSRRLYYMRPEALIRDRRQRAADLVNALNDAFSERLRCAKEREDSLSRELRGGMEQKLSSDRLRLGKTAGVWQGLSPLARLSQGYTFTKTASGEALTSIDRTEIGDRLLLYAADGKIEADVTGKEKIGYPYKDV